MAWKYPAAAPRAWLSISPHPSGDVLILGADRIGRDLRRQPVFGVTALVGFIVNFAVLGLSFAQPLYFQQVLMYSPVATGVAFTPFALTVTLSNVLGGRLAAQFGIKLPIIGGLFLTAAGFALLYDIDASTTYVAMLPSQSLIRIGVGLSYRP